MTVRRLREILNRLIGHLADRGLYGYRIANCMPGYGVIDVWERGRYPVSLSSGYIRIEPAGGGKLLVAARHFEFYIDEHDLPRVAHLIAFPRSIPSEIGIADAWVRSRRPF